MEKTLNVRGLEGYGIQAVEVVISIAGLIQLYQLVISIEHTEQTDEVKKLVKFVDKILKPAGLRSEMEDIFADEVEEGNSKY